MTKAHVTTSVNGDPYEFLCEPGETLLTVLRDDLQLTGTKEGCGSGDCGACSVMLNGRLVCSCLVLGVEAEGADVQTVEGIGNNDSLHVIQEKFLEHAALQCGTDAERLVLLQHRCRKLRFLFCAESVQNDAFWRRVDA